jgi:hypothetical protein
VQVKISDLKGCRLYAQTITVSKGSNKIMVQQLYLLLPGIYLLELTEQDTTNKYINKIIKY